MPPKDHLLAPEHVYCQKCGRPVLFLHIGLETAIKDEILGNLHEGTMVLNLSGRCRECRSPLSKNTSTEHKGKLEDLYRMKVDDATVRNAWYGVEAKLEYAEIEHYNAILMEQFVAEDVKILRRDGTTKGNKSEATQRKSYHAFDELDHILGPERYDAVSPVLARNFAAAIRSKDKGDGEKRGSDVSGNRLTVLVSCHA